jgi:hypothetical protein
LHPFPFIVGRGRSGTTLVRAMLDSHPHIAVPDESHFILVLARRRRRYERPEGFAAAAFLDDLERHPNYRWMGVDPDRVRSDLLDSPPVDYVDAVRRVFAVYARDRGKPRYADKTPSHVLSLPALSRLFPEGRFVHVIRDGRDVALSYLDVPWGPRSVAEAAFLWKRAVTRGRRNGNQLGRDGYRELRYEELVDRPEPVVAEVCEFLELEFVPEMLRYFERADQVADSMQFPETRQALRLPPTKGVRDWRAQMSRSDLVDFEAIAGGLLSELGYERGVPKIRPADRVRARAVEAAIRAKRGRARAARIPRRLASWR